MRHDSALVRTSTSHWWMMLTSDMCGNIHRQVTVSTRRHKWTLTAAGWCRGQTDSSLWSRRDAPPHPLGRFHLQGYRLVCIFTFIVGWIWPALTREYSESYSLQPIWLHKVHYGAMWIWAVHFLVTDYRGGGLPLVVRIHYHNYL